MITEPWLKQGFSGRRYITPHFELISTLRDASFEAALPAFLESAYEQYQETLPIATTDRATRRLTMYLFATKAEWLRYVRRHHPDLLETHQGLGQNGFTLDDTSMTYHVDRAATLAALAHEGWLQYVHTHFPDTLPGWLNQGLACYQEALQLGPQGPVFTPRQNTSRLIDLRKAIQSNHLIPLRRLVASPPEPFLRGHHVEIALRYHAQVWALVSLLQHGAQGRYAADFERMLQDITHGTFKARLSAAALTDAATPRRSRGETALAVYFARTPDSLERDYFNHLLQLTGFDHR